VSSVISPLGFKLFIFNPVARLGLFGRVLGQRHRADCNRFSSIC
jgi:hypothetical protein